MAKQITQIFILAAGRGERMRPLTDSIPKPLVKIGGKSILSYILEKIIKLPEPKKIIINSYYLGEAIDDYIKNSGYKNITISRENEKLETGGGISYAIKNGLIDINQPILIINSDILWENKSGSLQDLQLLINNFDEKEMDILLGIKHKTKYPGYEGNGDFNFNPENKTLIKPNPETTPDYAFVGIQILHPRIFQNHPEGAFSLNYFYKKARKEDGTLDKIKGIKLQENYIHIGTAKMVEEINGVLY